MSDYSYLTGEGTPSLPELGTEVAASFVPGLNVAQALRDYKKSVAEKDYAGMGLSALGLVPGVGALAKLGGAAKSAALIALLRGKSDLMLSRGAAGTHLLNVAGEELNPSFGIAKNKLMGTFGDTVLVPKHGKFDPSTGASKLYAEDAFTSEHGIPSSTYATPPTFSSFEEFTNNAKGANRLTTRNITASDMPKELKPKFDQFSKSVGLDPNDFESMLYVLRTMHPEDVTAAPKYIKTLHDYTMNLSPVSYAELKVKGPVKLSPENYAGVIHSGTDQNVATALANLVRQRGVPFHQMSESDASIANMMQIIAGE